MLVAHIQSRMGDSVVNITVQQIGTQSYGGQSLVQLHDLYESDIPCIKQLLMA